VVIKHCTAEFVRVGSIPPVSRIFSVKYALRIFLLFPEYSSNLTYVVFCYALLLVDINTNTYN
jgi:hypothetical protein